MNRLLLVPVLGLSVLATAAPARAQLGGWLDSNRPAYADAGRQPYYEIRRAAYDNGYREGLKEGEKDGRKGDRYDFRDENAWRKGDKGYHRSYGDRDRYRQTFRAAFESGYADGYRRYGGYGPGRYGDGRAIPRRPAPYPNRRPGTYPGEYGRYPYPYGYGYNAAYENGVRDGYAKGQEDGRGRRSYDPLRHKWYRSADRDHRGEYGPKDDYRNQYREGFKAGYDRGYRGYGYRGD